ncbi:hypothetical protein B0O80DRAFT_533471 [Mortierella sp. GBAus27b]|nr:HAUS augmin-like complex subunit 1 [Mortierella sp. GBA43]KAI8346663.1 hypothetical protein B0O80DRAFT_533471 [Mortierella sp. GBAus27b]
MWPNRHRETIFSKTHNSEWSQIDRWLQSKYRGQDIPAFERTEESAKVLLELMRLNQKQDAHAQEAILALQQLSSSYQSEDVRLQEILQVLGLQKDRLPSDSKRLLSQLSDLAMLLGTSDTTMASYHQALAQLRLDLTQYSQQQKDQGARQAALEKSHAKAKSELVGLLELKRHWARERDTRGDIEQRTRRRSIELNRIKAVDDKEALERIQRYGSLDAEAEGLTIAQLDSKEETVAILQRQLAAQNKMLSAYQEIPPDYTLAKLKLKEAELRLNELLAEQESLLTDMASGL